MCRSSAQGGRRCRGCITRAITNAKADIIFAEIEGHAGKKQSAVARLEMWEERMVTLIENEGTSETRSEPATRTTIPTTHRLSKLVNLALTSSEREDMDRELAAKGIQQNPGEPLTSEAIAYIREQFNSPHNVDTSVYVQELGTPRNTKAKGFTGRPPSKQGTTRSERLPIKISEEMYARFASEAAFFELSVTSLLRYKFFGTDFRKSESHISEKRQDAREFKFATMEKGKNLADVYSEAAIHGGADSDTDTTQGADTTTGETDTYNISTNDTEVDTAQVATDTLQPQDT